MRCKNKFCPRYATAAMKVALPECEGKVEVLQSPPDEPSRIARQGLRSFEDTTMEQRLAKGWEQEFLRAAIGRQAAGSNMNDEGIVLHSHPWNQFPPRLQPKTCLVPFEPKTSDAFFSDYPQRQHSVYCGKRDNESMDISKIEMAPLRWKLERELIAALVDDSRAEVAGNAFSAPVLQKSASTQSASDTSTAAGSSSVDGDGFDLLHV